MTMHGPRQKHDVDLLCLGKEREETSAGQPHHGGKKAPMKPQAFS